MPRKRTDLEPQYDPDDGERLLTPAVDYYLTRLSELVSIAAVIEPKDEQEIQEFIDWACAVAPGPDNNAMRIGWKAFLLFARTVRPAHQAMKDEALRQLARQMPTPEARS